MGWLAPPAFLPGPDGEGSLQKGTGDTGKADQERGQGSPPPSFATGCEGMLVLRVGRAKTSCRLGSLFCPARMLPRGSCLCLIGQPLDCAHWAEALPSALEPSLPSKPSQRRTHAGHTSRGSEDAAALPPTNSSVLWGGPGAHRLPPWADWRASAPPLGRSHSLTNLLLRKCQVDGLDIQVHLVQLLHTCAQLGHRGQFRPQHLLQLK